MPEVDKFEQPGVVFERNVAALVPASSKGGIIAPEKYKSWVVNIRPKGWPEALWIGQIEDFVTAQFSADFVYHYIGQPAFHLKHVALPFPPLKCGDATLSDREACSQHILSVKGRAFKVERAQFKKSVKALLLEVLQRVDVQRLLVRVRGATNPAPAPVPQAPVGDGDEVAVGDRNEVAVAGGDDGAGGGGDEGPVRDEGAGGDGDEDGALAPMEVDADSELAALLSQFAPSSHVPGFVIDGPDFSLRSAFLPLEYSRVEDFTTTGNNDEDEHVEENSIDSSVFDDNFGPNDFFVMDDVEVDLMH